MAKAAEERKGAPAKESLSEVRTTVLGPQILLGFQFQAIFQTAFATLPPWRKGLELGALGLLMLTIALAVAPASHHQIVEGGQRDEGQVRFGKAALIVTLAVFAAGIAAALLFATAGDLGVGPAAMLAAAATAAALMLWYGAPLMARAAKKPDQPRPGAGPGQPSLKEKLEDVMTETRIALPGVQALLGFQFAAYLTPAFAKLPADARVAHGVSLALLLLSMILLMTPAPFHRIAEAGADTERAHKVGAAAILTALAALGLGLTADLYVAVDAVARDRRWAIAAAALAAIVFLILWFAAPLAARAAGRAGSDRRRLSRARA